MQKLRHWWNKHPNLLSWAVLAVGMVVILIWSAWHVGFTPGQWTAMIIATVILAGLSVWIISWEENEPESDAFGDEVDTASQTEAPNLTNNNVDR